MAKRKGSKAGESFTSKLFSNLKRGVSALKTAITRSFTRAAEKRQQAEQKKIERDSVPRKKGVSALKTAITRPFKRGADKNRQRIEQKTKEIEAEVAKQVEDAIETSVKTVLDEAYSEKSQKAQEEIWIRKRREQDIADREYAKEIEAGELIYKQVNDLIAAYPTQGAKFLDKALAKEIAKYGRDAVLQGMANAPESVISAAQDILYYEEGAEAIHTAFIRFFESIMGTKIGDYAQELGDVIDEMADYDEP